MSLSVKSITKGLLVLSLFALVACQSKNAKQEATKTSSTSQVSHSSSVKKSSTSGQSQATKGSSEASHHSSQAGSNQVAKEPSSEQSTASSVPATTQVSGIDINAVVMGDFSSVVGTWTNDKGDSVTFTAQGLQSDDMELSPNGVANGVANFTYAPKNSATGSAALVMIPAGTAAVGGTVYDRDAIVIGQSTSAEESPYYRQ